jgi:hypothetical protein
MVNVFAFISSDIETAKGFLSFLVLPFSAYPFGHEHLA